MSRQIMIKSLVSLKRQSLFYYITFLFWSYYKLPATVFELVVLLTIAFFTIFFTLELEQFSSICVFITSNITPAMAVTLLYYSSILFETPPNRCFNGYEAIIDAAGEVWNDLCNHKELFKSITYRDWFDLSVI